MKETPERVLDDLGRRVAELRRSAGLTQQQVAETLGMLVGDYQDIERGARNCTVRTLVHVARSLGVPTRMLFEAPNLRWPRQPGRPPRAHYVEHPPDKPAAMAVEEKVGRKAGSTPKRTAAKRRGKT